MLRYAQHDISFSLSSWSLTFLYGSNFGIPESRLSASRGEAAGPGALTASRRGPVHAPRMRPAVFRFADSALSGHKPTRPLPRVLLGRAPSGDSTGHELHPRRVRQTKRPPVCLSNARSLIACLSPQAVGPTGFEPVSAE